MKTIRVDEVGAIGDGVFDNSKIFQRALHELAETGSGTLIIPPGQWRTGPIDLPSNCTFKLESGCTVSFIAEFDRYRPIWTRWEGVECYAMHPCISVREATDVVITGEGTIDGSGNVWWNYRSTLKAHNRMNPVSDIEHTFARLNPDYVGQPGGGGGRATQFLAPPLIQFYRCSNVKIEHVTVQNSPFWTIHPVYCEDVHIDNVKVINPYDAPNTDGIDIDSCSRVNISRCCVDVGDDAIVLKSGSGSDGMKVGIKTKDVVISDCNIKRAHGGVVIGSETAGGVENVKATGCTFEQTDRGIRVKTRRGRGGAIRNLSFTFCTMVDNLCPIAVNMYYRCGILDHEKTHAFSTDLLPLEHETPSIEQIEIKDVKATGSKASAAFFAGLPEAPIQNLVVENCHLGCDMASTVDADESEMYEGLPKGRSKNVRIRNCSNAAFRSVAVDGPEEPFTIEDAIRIVIE